MKVVEICISILRDSGRLKSFVFCCGTDAMRMHILRFHNPQICFLTNEEFRL